MFILGTNDVLEFDATEATGEFPQHFAIGTHVVAIAVPIAAGLVDDQGGVPVDDQSGDAKRFGDAQAVDGCFILSCIIGGDEVNP